MLPIKYQKQNTRGKFNRTKSSHFEKDTAIVHIILLNKAFRVILLLFLTATIIPITVYLMVFSREIGPLEYDRNQVGTCGHLKSLRVSCGIHNISENSCIERGCCFSRTEGCYHSLPARHQYYNSLYMTKNHIINLQPLRKMTPLGFQSIYHLQLVITALTKSHARLNLWNSEKSDGNKETIHIIRNKINEDQNTDYDYVLFQPVIYIEFRRKEDNSLLLTTSRGPLIATENFFEWTFFLGSQHLFGFGDLNVKPGFKIIHLNNHLTDAIPFILAQNVTTQKFHGLYISSPYPVEIEITESYLVIVKAIFHSSFQIDIFCGPTIKDVMNQLATLSGRIPRNYPSWFFGLHICDTDFTRSLSESINEAVELLESNIQAFDSHCIREHLLLLGDDEEDVIREVGEILVRLKKSDKKIVAHIATVLDASKLKSLAYLSALDSGILMRSASSDEPYVGCIRNKSVVYVDWIGADKDHLQQWCRKFWPTKFQVDAYMLQSNWMQDDSESVKTPSSFPYVSTDLIKASLNITPWNIRSCDKRGSMTVHSHNLVASTQIEFIRNFVLNDTFVMSESSLFGNVPTISRHVKTTWLELKNKVRHVMGHAISGIYFWSANVCGDEELMSEELCIRWYQFASLSPIYRVTSSKAPNKFSRYSQKIIKALTLRRYSFMSYFRTIVDAGKPLIAPMFYEYPDLVPDISNLDHQMLIGSSLLFAPVLLPGAQRIKVFFPELYYEIEGGQPIQIKKWNYLSVVEGDAPLFIRGGHILPIHNTTDSFSISEVQNNLINLYVAFANNSNGKMTAVGEILINEYETITFTATLFLQVLNISSVPQLICNESTLFLIHYVKIYGIAASDFGLQVFYLDVNQNLCQNTLNFTMDLSNIEL